MFFNFDFLPSWIRAVRSKALAYQEYLSGPES
jgi:hypothetical protein